MYFDRIVFLDLDPSDLTHCTQLVAIASTLAWKDDSTYQFKIRHPSSSSFLLPVPPTFPCTPHLPLFPSSFLYPLCPSPFTNLPFLSPFLNLPLPSQPKQILPFSPSMCPFDLVYFFWHFLFNKIEILL